MLTIPIVKYLLKKTAPIFIDGPVKIAHRFCRKVCKCCYSSKTVSLKHDENLTRQEVHTCNTQKFGRTRTAESKHILHKVLSKTLIRGNEKHL